MTIQYKFPKEAYGADLTFDLESNGLLEDKKEFSKSKGLIVHAAADRIWMCCHRDNKTGICYDFIDDEMLSLHGRAIKRHNRQYGRDQVHLYPLSALPAFWEITGRQTGHNAQKFDFPLVEKLLGYHMPRDKRWDTLIQSQTQFCDREHVAGSTTGPHSVESWAIRINKGSKVEHEDWLNFSIDMYRRCWRDVEVQCDILVALEDEREADRLECNIDWTKALHTEHMAAFWISYSEIWGYPIDQVFANQKIKDWDKELADLEDELLPNMPFRITHERCGTKVNWETYVEGMLKNSGLSRLPLGWCWEEDSGNKPQPVWKPFKKNGDVSSSVETYFLGKEAQPAKPEEPAIEAQPAVLDENGKVVKKAVRARKAKPAVAAKDRVPSCYEDDAGLTDPPLIKFGPEDVAGPFTRIQWSNYNLGSNNQVLEYLTLHTKWQPTEYTEKGNPKLTEDSFDSIGDGESGIGEKIKYYLITKSRRTNVKNFKDPTKGWLNNVRADGRVTPVNNTMGTPTTRSRHAVIVNVPSGSALHGADMRRCWVAAEGCRQLGIDAAAIEARAMASEIDCDATRHEIVDGDFHTAVWDTIPDFSSSRSHTKGIEYALLYGASDAKLGSLADIPNCREKFASVDKLILRGWEQDKEGLWRHKRWNPKKPSLLLKEAQETVCGSIIRKRIMDGLQPLGAAIDRFVKMSEKGYLVSIDGRKLNCRSSHSAFNLRLQSTGAIICKTAMILTMNKLEQEGFVVVGKDHDPKKHVQLYTFYHDELQLGVPEHLFEDKVFNVDFSEFDLSDKKQKKLAEKKAGKAISRFVRRELRQHGKYWSRPKIDFEKGTVLISYSRVGDIATEAFYDAGTVNDFPIAVESEFDVGANWLECH